MTGSLMGAVIGTWAGCGVLLLVSRGGVAEARGPVSRAPARRARATSPALLATCAASALTAGVLGLLITALPAAALIAAVVGAGVPVAVRRRRARARSRAIAAAWPDAVDSLAAGIRAGMGLGEATAALSARGPDVLRPAFARFAVEYRATGSLALALRVLRDAADDPVADRVVVALGLTREVGGTELGHLLRTLSAMLREDARTRAEISARQSWTVAAARMAVAAPWLTLALLCTRPDAARAYASATGAAVLVVAALLSAFAYLLMVRIGRLPSDIRIGGS